MSVLFKGVTILLVQFGRSYRPELHYMRGPGPSGTPSTISCSLPPVPHEMTANVVRRIAEQLKTRSAIGARE